MSETSETPTFKELGLSDQLLQALTRVGYETPSPIQAASIPPLMQGNDFIGQAQTGTGKTAAFALPLLQNLDIRQAHPQALVLTPTRELAIQVAEAFQAYARHMKDFHVLPLYGGQDMRGQLRSLKRGAHVVVGTPGRLLDHLGRKTLDLSKLRTVVLDEADEMLRMGFIDDVNEILANTPDDCQTALFSATLPDPIRKIAERQLTDPVRIKIEAATATVDTIEQVHLFTHPNDKLDRLTRILEAETSDAVIIFVRTRDATVTLAEKLSARGYRSAALNGDLSQNQREQTIRQLKSSQIDVLIATDVAARGLDVERIELVINYDIPYDSEAYVHRIGRTGRAGRQGKAILLVAPREKRLLHSIERSTGHRIKRYELPTAQDLAKQRREKLIESVGEAIEKTLPSLYLEIIEQACHQLEASPADVAAAILSLSHPIEQLDPPPEPVRPKREYEKKDRKPRQDRERGGERGERGERGGGPGKLRNHPDVELEQFQIAVGRSHGVSPGDIVGAIANEADIEAKYIGRIQLRDDYSLIDLPQGMPEDVLQHLKKVRVRSQALRIRKYETRPPRKKPSKRPAGDDE